MTDDALRIFIYDRFVASGTAPTSADIAAYFGIDTAAAKQRLAALKFGKTVLVSPSSGEIWMAGPFCATKSAYALSDGTTTWYANCAWDMFGVALIVGKPLIAEAQCADCRERIAVECDPAHPPVECQALVHFLVPAKHWYEDIGFT